MVSNCANPACATPLRYLRDGRLYQFEVKALDVPGADQPNLREKKPSRHVWHFWLCGHCSPNLTLQFDQLQGLKVVPLHPNYSRLVS